MLAAEKYNEPELLNFGSGKAVNIKSLIETLKDVIGYCGSINWDASKPNGQPRRLLNSAKTYDLVGWKPETSLHDGLVETIEWYRKYSK